MNNVKKRGKCIAYILSVLMILQTFCALGTLAATGDRTVINVYDECVSFSRPNETVFYQYQMSKAFYRPNVCTVTINMAESKVYEVVLNMAAEMVGCTVDVKVNGTLLQKVVYGTGPSGFGTIFDTSFGMALFNSGENTITIAPSAQALDPSNKQMLELKDIILVETEHTVVPTPEPTDAPTAEPTPDPTPEPTNVPGALSEIRKNVNDEGVTFSHGLNSVAYYESQNAYGIYRPMAFTFSVTVPNDKVYEIYLRSAANPEGCKMEITDESGTMIKEVVYGTGFTDMADRKVGEMYLSAGTHTITAKVSDDGYNTTGQNVINFGGILLKETEIASLATPEPTDAPTAEPTPDPTPEPTTAPTLAPGEYYEIRKNVNDEGVTFSHGLNSVAYYESQNAYGIYRPMAFNFEINIPKAKVYEVYLRSAANPEGCKMEVTDETGFKKKKVIVGAGFSDMSEHSVGLMYFTEGDHVITAKVSDDGYNTTGQNVINFGGVILRETDYESLPVVEETFYPGDNSSNTVDTSLQLGSGENENDGWKLTDGNYAEFEIYVPEATTYELSANLGALDDDVLILINGEDVAYENIINTGDFYNTKSMYLASKTLSAGTHKIRVLNSAKTAGNGIHFKNITLTPFANIAIDEIKAGTQTITDGAQIAKGTDVFEITMSKFISDSQPSAQICLTDGNTVIPTEVSYSDKTVKVAIKEALAENTEYTLSAANIKDSSEKSTAAGSLTFTTNGADSGESLTTDLSVTDTETSLVLSGKVLSSQGIGIEGRNVLITVTNEVGVEKAHTTVTSGADGIINYTYNILNDEDGTYTFTVLADYEQSAKTISEVFLTQSVIEEIEAAFAGADNETDVKNVLNTYEEKLRIDADVADGRISDSALLTSFYESFCGYNQSPKEFASVYNKRLVVYDLKDSTTAAEINAILLNKTDCESLGTDYEKLNLLSANGQLPASLLQLVMDMNKDNEITFAQELGKQIDKELLAKYSKTSDTIVQIGNISINAGQNVTKAIGFVSFVTNAKKVVIKISVEDSELMQTLAFAPCDNITSRTTYSNGTAQIELTGSGIENGVQDLGTLTLSPKNITASYQMTVGAEIQYVISNYEITNALPDENITISVVKNANRVDGTPIGSVGSNGGGKPAISDTTPPVNDDVLFNDLDSVSWANEAITSLANDGILSKPADKKFRPDDNVTRAEFIKMIVEAKKCMNIDAKADFSDVSENAWYYVYVASAVENGYVTGDTDGNFNPDAHITREDMSVIIDRVLGENGASASETDEKFTDDDDISEYAKEAVYNTKAKGIINGMGDGSFAPKNSATRAMAAKVIYEMIKAVRA